MLHFTKLPPAALAECGTGAPEAKTAKTTRPVVSAPKKSGRSRTRSLPPRVEVRQSAVHGRGVYALTRIPQGKRIIEYKGQLVPWEKASPQADGPHTFLFGLTNGKDVIDPEIGGNEACWINHSCAPNCEAIEEGRRVFIYALRLLQTGQELFYDYGLEVDEPRTKKLEREYECRCGSPRCRGTLLGG